MGNEFEKNEEHAIIIQTFRTKVIRMLRTILIISSFLRLGF